MAGLTLLVLGFTHYVEDVEWVQLARSMGGSSGAAVPVSPPTEFQEAEAAGRQLLESIGIATKGLEIRYVKLGSGADLGIHKGGRIIVNLDAAKNAGTVFHEVWHYAQQELEGRARFERAYEKYRPLGEANPYEVDARKIQDRLQSRFEWMIQSPLYGRWNGRKRFVEWARGEVRRFAPAALPP
jgi:hypothetical protein